MSRERSRELGFISVSHARTVKAPAVGTRSGRFPRCLEVWKETHKPPKKLIYPLCGSQEQQNDLCILFPAGGAVNKGAVGLGGAEPVEGEFQDPSPWFPAAMAPFPGVSLPAGARLRGQGQGAGAAAAQLTGGSAPRERPQGRGAGPRQEGPSPAAPGQEAQRADRPEEEQEERQGEMKEPDTWCSTLKSRVRPQKPKMPLEPPGPAGGRELWGLRCHWGSLNRSAETGPRAASCPVTPVDRVMDAQRGCRMAAKMDIKHPKQSAVAVMFFPATVKDKCPGKAARRQSTAVGAVPAPKAGGSTFSPKFQCLLIQIVNTFKKNPAVNLIL